MADDDPQPDETSPPPAAPSPMLQGFQSAFTAPEAQGWAGDVATRINDYDTRRDIADKSQQAGEKFVQNLDDFKTGLTSAVTNDPQFVHTALDIVSPTVGALISTLPGGIENPEDHHAAVTGHIEHEIAAAAVTSAAERHEALARGMLANERISGILGDSAGPLDTYISVQAAARAADHQAQVDQLQKDQANRVDRSVGSYASALVDPAGGVRFPDGWNQGVMADPKVSPPAKAMLAGMYSSLRAGGDVPQSDPQIVSKLVAGVAGGADVSVPAVLAQAGSTLKLQDALMLSNMPQGDATQLHNALEQGRAALATPENGQAGQEAFAKFTNWLLPAARNGANLDPSSPDYVLPANRMQGFAPTAANMVDVAYRTPVAERRQLSEIFSNPEYSKPTRANPTASFGGSAPSRPQVPYEPPVPMTYRRVAGGGVELVPAVSMLNVPGAEDEGRRLMARQAKYQQELAASGQAPSNDTPPDMLGPGQLLPVAPRAAARPAPRGRRR